VSEGRLLCAALDELGVETVPAVWDSDGVAWGRFSAVIIRTTEDYFRNLPGFLSWAWSLDGRLYNDPRIVSWNVDKQGYLRELSEAGIPVVRTWYAAPGQPYRIPSGTYVVKPAISAGSNQTRAYGEGEESAAIAHIAALHRAGRTVMVQPYYERVDTDGETAVVYVDGAVCGCMRKEPVLALGRPPSESLPEEMSVRSPQGSALELAARVHSLVAARFGVPLYARIDMVPDEKGNPVVIEAELTEPLLFLDHLPGSADMLAAALLRRARLIPGLERNLAS
jgi:hypothetical protein